MRIGTRLVGALALGTLALFGCSSGSTAPGATKATGAKNTGSKSGDPAAVPAAKSTGCGTAANVPAGSTKQDITSGGDARWYHRNVPPAYDGRVPVPLVLDLHGYSEGADVHVMMSGLEKFGDTKGFVTITPQGSGAVARWDTAKGSKDLAFLGDVLDAAERDLCVDTNRVFVTGLSNGAFMTSAVACFMSDRVAAVAPVAGARNLKGCAPKRPVPMVAFHGTADGYVAYDGGLGEKALDLPAPDGSGKTLRDTLTPEALKSQGGDSIPKIMADWAHRNGCGQHTTEQAVAADVTRIAFDCPAAGETVLYRVTGGGHTWPGSAFSQSIASVVGPTTMNIVADAIMWDFFTRHPLVAGTK
ncbi:MAG: PHB depolymerase family esterase [Acidimicrobiia bacterium]